jgi:hypothetical protein
MSTVGIELTEAQRAIEVMKSAGRVLDGLKRRLEETQLHLVILTDYLEKHGLCRCENNGDYCEFHEMLFNAKQALKGKS